MLEKDEEDDAPCEEPSESDEDIDIEADKLNPNINF